MATKFGIKDMINALESDGYELDDMTRQEVVELYNEVAGFGDPMGQPVIPDYSEGYWPSELPSYGS
jgi:hypothetical protein